MDTDKHVPNSNYRAFSLKRHYFQAVLIITGKLIFQYPYTADNHPSPGLLHTGNYKKNRRMKLVLGSGNCKLQLTLSVNIHKKYFSVLLISLF